MEEGRDSQRRDRKVDEDSSDRKIRRMLLRRARREGQRSYDRPDSRLVIYMIRRLTFWANILEQTVFAVKRM